MPDPAPPDPPMVLRVEPPARARPRPGLLEAVLWCVAFLAAQVTGAVLFGGVAFAAAAVRSENPEQFANDQLAALGKTTTTPAAEQQPLPPQISSALAWAMLGAQVTSLVLIALVVPRRIGSDWKRQLGLRRPPVTHVLLVVMMVPGFIILPSGIAVLLEMAGARPLPGAAALKGVFAPWPAWLTVLAVGVGPGVVEELWCRGFLGRGLCARYGLWGGVFLTSVLFGLLHLHPVYALIVAVMGAFLHFTYIASRSLWTPILLHALHNGVGMLMELKGVLIQFHPAQNPLVWVMCLTSFALLLFGAIALWTGRAEVRGPKLKDPTFAPEYPGVSAPPRDSADTLGRAETSAAAFTITMIAFGILLYVLTR